MYYPDQNAPRSGACGLGICNGTMEEPEELTADSDFERTFGTVDTCSTAAGDDEVCAVLSRGTYHGSGGRRVVQIEEDAVLSKSKTP